MIRRTAAAAVLVVAALSLVIAAWPQLFGLQHTAFVAQIVSLRGLAIACSLLCIVALLFVALLSRAFRRFCASLGLVLLVFVAVSAAVLATRGFGDTSFQKKGPADITVLSWNTLGDTPGAEAIAKLALDTGADVVSLPETTSETAIAVAQLMKAQGKAMWVHSQHYDLISKARSTSLLMSVDLGQYSVDTDHRTTNVLPTVVAVPADGSGPTIIAVHAVAPIPGQLNHWKLDLRWLADACDGGNTIMAGDFNSTIDHFSGLAATPGAALGNCFDAATSTKNAAVGTWPVALPPLLGAPIDHVMATSDWQVTGMRVIESQDASGSDHRPIVVQLSRRGGQ